MTRWSILGMVAIVGALASLATHLLVPGFQEFPVAVGMSISAASAAVVFWLFERKPRTPGAATAPTTKEAES